MYVTNVNDKKAVCVTKSGNRIHWLLTSEVGAPHFELRYIEIPPDGRSSDGSHPHEHEVFVVKGQGLHQEPQRRDLPDARHGRLCAGQRGSPVDQHTHE